MLRYAPSQKSKVGEITADIINQHLNEAAFKEAVILANSNGTPPSLLQAQVIGLN
jgi:hypothetical protein